MPNYPRYAVLPPNGVLFNLDSSGGIFLQDIDLDSSPDMMLDTWDVARKDGGKVVSSTYKPKKIPLKGTVVGTSFADLNAKLDAFKASCCGNRLSLYCDDGVTCKLFYVALTGMATFNRSKKGPTASDFAINYQILDEPFGSSSTFGAGPTTVTAINDLNVTIDIYTNTVTFSGTAPPAGTINLTVTTPGDLTTLQFVDVTNSRTLTITPTVAITSGDIISINTVTPSVSLNNAVVPFTGQFPAFQPNIASSIAVYAYTTSGYSVDQSQTLANVNQVFLKSSTIYSQSFTTGSYSGGSAPISRISFIANRIGNPTAYMYLRIFADNGSGTAPSGSQYGGTVSIPPTAFSTIFQYLNIAVAGLPILNSATKYWFSLSIDAVGTDINNYYQLRGYTNTPAGYSGGGLFVSGNGGSTYAVVATTSLAFKTFYSVIGQNNQVIDYLTAGYTENFNTTTKKDAANTNASWVNTGANILKMTGVLTTQTDALATGGGITMQLAAGSSLYGIASSFVAQRTGILQTVTLTLRRGQAENTNFTVQIAPSLPTSNPFPYIGSIDNHMLQSSLTNTFAQYTFTVNAPVVAGTLYYIEILYPDTSTGISYPIYILAGSNYGATPATVNSVIYQLSVSGGVTAQNFGGSSNGYNLESSIVTQYTIYSAQEYAQTVELASTSADILSVSQASTSALSGGALVMQASVDGSTWFALANNTSPYGTENIPPAAGSALYLKWLLQNTANPTSNPQVSLTSLDYKKGLSLDASTKYGAQSFYVSSGNSIGRLDLFLAQLGNVSGTVTVNIQTNSSGPSGTVVANGSATLSTSAIVSQFGWISFNFTTFPTLAAGNYYWIVVKVTGTLNSTNRILALANNNGYGGGSLKKSINSGTSWTDITSSEDLLFRIFTSSGSNFSYNMNLGYTPRFS